MWSRLAAHFQPFFQLLVHLLTIFDKKYHNLRYRNNRQFYPARARSARAQRACALRALGLLLADGTPTGGRGEDFLSRQPDFFTETAVTPERKVEKWFPRWEINRHAEG